MRLTTFRTVIASRRAWLGILLVVVMLVPSTVFAAGAGFDGSLVERGAWTGHYGHVAGGVGLMDSSSGTFGLTVPGTAIAAAYLYWAGNDVGDSGSDNQVTLSNGTSSASVTADTTYGPSDWYGDRHHYVYVKNVTSLGIVQLGTHSYTVSGLDMAHRYGAGLMVVYQDENLSDTVELVTQVREGLDSAYYEWGGDRGPNTEVTCFQFPADDQNVRTMDFSVFVGGIDTSDQYGTRWNNLWYQTGTGALPTNLVGESGAGSYTDPVFSSIDGDEWDTFTNQISIPVGAEWACLQVESTDKTKGASLLWLAAGATIRTTKPTAVDVASFDAAVEGNAVRLSWTTANELDVLGFNVLRADSVTGPRVQLNEDLIVSQAPGSVSGASYAFVDGDLVDGATYAYWIQGVGLDGELALHGPVTVETESLMRLRPARFRLGVSSPTLRQN